MLLFYVPSYCLRSVQRSYDWQTEKSLYKSGLEVCPRSAKMHYNYAKMLQDPRDGSLVTENDHKSAKEHYEIALDLWPKFSNAIINLGTIYEKSGKYTEAEKLYRKALDMDPHFAVLWMNLGVVEGFLEKHKEAEHSFKVALYLGFDIIHSKSYPQCLFNLGTLYMNTGEFEKAISYFEKALKADPNHFGAQINLSGLSLRYYNYLSDKCGSINVFGDSKQSTGTYKMTYKVAKIDVYGKRPVWKLNGKERYIFHTGSKEGWRIGSNNGLETGTFFFKSESNELPFKKMEWKNGKGSTVRVKCIGMDDILRAVSRGQELDKESTHEEYDYDNMNVLGDYDDFDSYNENEDYDTYDDILSKLEEKISSSTITTPAPPSMKNLEHFESSFATKQRMLERYIAMEANKTISNSKKS